MAGAYFSVGVTVGPGHIYRTNSEVKGSLGRADLDGQNVNQSSITGLLCRRADTPLRLIR